MHVILRPSDRNCAWFVRTGSGGARARLQPPPVRRVGRYADRGPWAGRGLCADRGLCGSGPRFRSGLTCRSRPVCGSGPMGGSARYAGRVGTRGGAGTPTGVGARGGVPVRGGVSVVRVLAQDRDAERGSDEDLDRAEGVADEVAVSVRRAAAWCRGRGLSRPCPGGVRRSGRRLVESLRCSCLHDGIHAIAAHRSMVPSRMVRTSDSRPTPPPTGDRRPSGASPPGRAFEGAVIALAPPSGADYNRPSACLPSRSAAARSETGRPFASRR